MSQIAVGCPCGKRFEVDPVHAGKQLACPGCGRLLPIPASAAPRGRPAAQPCARHPAEAATAGTCSTCGGALCPSCVRDFGYYCSAACRESGKAHAPALASAVTGADVAGAERVIRVARLALRGIAVLAIVVALGAAARWALRERGRELWRFDPDDAALMPPAALGAQVACVTGRGDLVLLTPDGAVAHQLALGGSPVYAAPVAIGDRLVVPLADGVAWLAVADGSTALVRHAVSGERRLAQLVAAGDGAVAVLRGPSPEAGEPARWPGSAAATVLLRSRPDGGHDVADVTGDPRGVALPVAAVGDRVITCALDAHGSAAVTAWGAAPGAAATPLGAVPLVQAGWATARGVLVETVAGVAHVDATGAIWRAAGVRHAGHGGDFVLVRPDEPGGGAAIVGAPWALRAAGPLVALDLATGAERWRLTDPTARTLVVANADYAVIACDLAPPTDALPTNREAAQAMGAALHGRWVEAVAPLLVVRARTGEVVRRVAGGQTALFAADGGLLVLRVELDPGLMGERQVYRTLVAMVDPETGRERWTLAVAGALVAPCLGGPGRLYALAVSASPGAAAEILAADSPLPRAQLVAIGW